MVPLDTLLRALRAKEQRHAEVTRSLEDPANFANPGRMTSLQKERGTLLPFHALLPRLEEALRDVEDAQAMLREQDRAPGGGGESERKGLQELLDSSTERLQALRREAEDHLVADDGLSHRDVILEIRGGTGGEEAALFARDLFRMYSRYAETHGWKVDVMDSSASERGGLKEVIAEVTGPYVYRQLRYESGGHRVQRVPETETQGRIHTSLATVAVLPKAEEVEISWKPDEVRVDTMRAGGPGGQKVNKTESAVRMTHLPTGIAVHCQDEKSQHKNRARAEAILRARLFEHKQRKVDAERAAFRKSQVGTGDRAEKIRTYNFPQNRVTDHRAGITIHSLDRMMDGDLDDLFSRLITWDRDLRLREMEGDGPGAAPGSLPGGGQGG